MNEKWKDVVGYESHYIVSSMGRVASVKKGRLYMMNPYKSKGGYMIVSLLIDSRRKCMKVHRLVAMSFIPNPECKDTVNHIDEVKSNNSLQNLEWMTMVENMNHGTRNKRISEKNKNNKKTSKKLLQIDDEGNVVKVWPSIKEASRAGFERRNISLVYRGKRKSHKGFAWELTK